MGQHQQPSVQDPSEWGKPMAFGAASILLAVFNLNGTLGGELTGAMSYIGIPVLIVGCFSFLLGAYLFLQRDTPGVLH